MNIRNMAPEEKGAVKKVMNRAFPLFLRLFYHFTKNILVAEEDGKILGGVILKTFRIDSNRRGGLICFIFADPNFTGRGVGQKLAEAGIDKLYDLGATDVFAQVLGDNTSSSKLFSNRGFNLLTTMEQFKIYGFKIFLIWFSTMHFFDVGHFLWAKSSKDSRSKSSGLSGFLWILFFHSLAGIITTYRWNRELDFKLISIYIVSICGLFILRNITMLAVAKIRGFKVKFLVWESGIVLNFLIGIAFGGLVTAPGSFYPVKKNSSYRDNLKDTGLMSLISSILLVGATISTYFLREIYPLLGITYSIAFTLALIDIALPFFPLSAYNGKRLWDWNKVLWGIVSLPILGLLIKGVL